MKYQTIVFCQNNIRTTKNRITLYETRETAMKLLATKVHFVVQTRNAIQKLKKCITFLVSPSETFGSLISHIIEKRTLSQSLKHFVFGWPSLQYVTTYKDFSKHKVMYLQIYECSQLRLKSMSICRKYSYKSFLQLKVQVVHYPTRQVIGYLVLK